MIKENISKMSGEHTKWLSGLDFYKQELDIMKVRLTEISGKNTGEGTVASIEHFENQIKLQNENIDILRHDIHSNLERSAAQLEQNGAGYIDRSLLTAHDEQNTRYVALENVINDLRKEFGQFASRWM